MLSHNHWCIFRSRSRSRSRVERRKSKEGGTPGGGKKSDRLPPINRPASISAPSVMETESCRLPKLSRGLLITSPMCLTSLDARDDVEEDYSGRRSPNCGSLSNHKSPQLVSNVPSNSKRNGSSLSLRSQTFSDKTTLFEVAELYRSHKSPRVSGARRRLDNSDRLRRVAITQNYRLSLRKVTSADGINIPNETQQRKHAE